jgi:hypothetical protein
VYVIWQRLLTSRPCLLLVDAWTTLNLEQDVYNYDKKLELDRHVQVSTYATSGLGLDLMKKAWPTLLQVFASDSAHISRNCPGRPLCLTVPAIDQLHKGFFNQNPPTCWS